MKSILIVSSLLFINTLPTLAQDSCGQITVKNITKESKSVYPVYIYKVDGKNIMGQRHTMNLPAGKHDVEVKELINDRTVNRFRQLNGTSSPKTLTIDVVKNKKYWLASKLIRSEKSNVRQGKHWEPIIWKEYEQNCQLSWFETDS